MPKVTIGPALPDRETLGVEIARLRDLDIRELRSRWHTVFGRPPPRHLPRHLLFRMVAYRLLHGTANRAGSVSRVPAAEIEALVISTLRELAHGAESLVTRDAD